VVTPLVSVITALSLDHVHILGDTLARIAFEKAGIIKPGRPVVLAPQPEEARQVIEEVALERGCPLYQVGRDFHYATGEHSLEGQSFRAWQAGPADPGSLDLRLPLLGRHQVENGATACAALRVAAWEGLAVPEEAIRRGFAAVRWPGRFELLRCDPPLIIDAAHNRESAARLRQALDEYLPGRPVVLLFGSSEDKDVEGMLAELVPRVRQVITTQSVHPRAMDAHRLAGLAQQQGGAPAQAILPLEDALAEAVRLAGSDAAVVAAGSLFIAAAVRDVWPKLVQNGNRAPDGCRGSLV
jgi:dihydrofolate synthase/folylpolyglutamate synthase